MKTPDEPTCNALVPLLDEGLLSLRETDRTALLLRYYERQSLREVGAAFGVNQGTAQKRIERALEKLAQFFQRRGFRTASVAATGAALKSTAATVAAETATAVVHAVLHASPAGLTGLTATVARAAALSKAQTAALCVAVAIIPVAWQWSRSHEVKNEVAAVQLKLDALRTRGEELAAETERLRAESRRLETMAARTVTTDVKEQEAAQKLEILKSRSRALLAADNYRWPDDLPFVRIPKSATASITMAGVPNTPAKLETKMNVLLDLSASEREATEQIFSNYFSGMDHLLATSLYETNQAMIVKPAPGADSKVFVLLPMGEQIRTALDQLCADLSGTLGEERWEMIRPDGFEFTHYEQNRLLGYTQNWWDRTQEVVVNIFTNAGGEPTFSWAAADGTGASAMPLRLFLPNQSIPFMGLSQGPPALMDSVTRWVTAEPRPGCPIL